MLSYFSVLFFLLCVGFVIYWFLLRDVLRQRAELAPFFERSDMLRASWWAKLKLSFAGLRTVMFAKLTIIAGIVLPLLDMIGLIDLTAILPPINVTSTWQITPPQYVPAFVLPMIGWINLQLRKITTTPVGVPSVEQIAAVMPEAPPDVVAEKAAEIAVAKAPPSAASGKD